MIAYKWKWEFHGSQFEPNGVKKKEKNTFFVIFWSYNIWSSTPCHKQKSILITLKTLYSTVRFFNLTSIAGVEIWYIGHSKNVFYFILSSDQIPECSNARF